MKIRKHPHLFEINALIFKARLSSQYNRDVSLNQFSTELLHPLQKKGFDLVWLMGVWRRSAAARACALGDDLKKEYSAALPDWQDKDVSGSPYAIDAYEVDPQLGSNQDLLKFKNTMNQKGIGVILDFVPNHLARDHAWTQAHSDYFVNGSLEDNQKNPGYFFLARPGVYLAHGRDPHFFPWQDTVQINFYSPELRKAHIEELLKIAQYCDGVRCDMAMLGLNSVFEKTWHPFLKNTPQATTEYWSDVIGAVKKKYPRFIFIAEAYWDLQWQLQKLGFDFTYDKKFYDLLFAANTSEIIGHLNADSDYRNRSVHFIENHDEARAVTHFGREKSFAAAAVMMTNPGLRFIYDGQIEGKTIRLPVQLTREPFEVGNPEAEEFYNLILLYSHHESLHEGEFRILPVISAWGNNISYKNVLAWAWVYKKELRMVVVNYSSEWSQAKVLLPKEWLKKCLVLRDWYSLDIFERSHEELQVKGLYIDLGPWSMHLFESRI